MDLLPRFSQTLAALPIAAGDVIIAAVSGGPDSLAMLHLFTRARARLDVTLVAVHVHHGIRGPAADADADFVRKIAEQWEVPCRIEICDVPSLARDRRWSLELAARRARYTALAAAARTEKARHIAVAHHADDQAETLLMHLLRGSGLAGMRGMRPVGKLSSGHLVEPLDGIDRIALLRPLLDVTRAEIDAYCLDQGLRPRIDETNVDIDLRRNRLRHAIMPLLREINPQASSALARLATISAADYDYLSDEVDRLWATIASVKNGSVSFSRGAFTEAPLALQRGLLRRAAQTLSGSAADLSFDHVESALDLTHNATSGKSASLPGRLRVSVAYEWIVIAHEQTAVDPPDWPLLPPLSCLTLDTPGRVVLPDSDWSFSIRSYEGPRQGDVWTRILADPWRAVLNEHVILPVRLRARLPGDRFFPQGAGGSQKVSDFQINAKIPAHWRDRLPMLESAGEIAWLCGWRVDQRYVVPDRDRSVWLASFDRL